MHKSVSSPNTPERGGSQLVSRTLSRVLNNAISSSNVVQRKIAERMDDLIAQSSGHDERAAIDAGAWSGSSEVTLVPHCAANRIENRAAANCCSRNRILPAWRARGCHKIGKREHVIAIVFRIGYWIERESCAVSATFSCAARFLCKSIGAVEWIRDAHLIEISVTRE